MTAAKVYGSSQIKPRRRSTKAEMRFLRGALADLVVTGSPMTVRHAFYRAVSLGLVDKTEGGYNRVQRQLAQMRRDWWFLERHSSRADGNTLRCDGSADWETWPEDEEGFLHRANTALPFSMISDNTRWTRKPTTWGSLEAALRNSAETYRRALWLDAPVHVEVWCESDSIAGTIAPVTNEYDVPLQVVRGFSSITYLYGAAQTVAEAGKPAFLYYFGDYDKAGGDIDRNVERDLREFTADRVDMSFERVAITSQQIEEFELPTKPGKDAAFGRTVEIEALDAEVLRSLVRDCIEQHVDRDQVRVLQTAEEDERRILDVFVGQVSA